MSVQPSAPVIPWDIRASKAIISAMAETTTIMWAQEQKGGRPWFLIGGCLFWLVIIYLVAAYYMIKVTLWAAIEAVLLAALVVVWCVSGPQRAVRAIRNRRREP